MKKKNMGKNKIHQRRRFYIPLFFSIFALLAIVIFQWKYKYHSYDSINPELTLYRDVVNGEGYLLLEEEVVYSKGTGVAVYNAQEGEKIPKDFLIANVNLMQDNSKIKDELIQVQAAIDYKNDSSDAKNENASLSVEEVNIIRNIQKFVRQESYEKLIASINSLDLHTKHSVNISDLNELLKLPLEDLENRKDKLSKALSTTDNEYRASQSGLVSYQIDDKDGILNGNKDLSQFNVSYLKKYDNTKFESGNNRVKKGQAFYRIINNLNWYMAIKIKDKKLLPFKEGDQLVLKTNKNRLLKGEYIQYNGKEKEEGVAIVKFQDKLSDFYLTRKQDLTIIKNELESYTIPSSSIIENEKGVTGVYIQEIHGLVQFVPVDIIGQTREEVYISQGNKNGRIKIGNKEFQTLTIHDNVIKNPEKVQSKQIVY